MAAKSAFFAALCLAQAFAFQPSSAVGGWKSTADRDYDILVGCFRIQKGRFTEIAERLTGVGVEAVQDLEGELREIAERYIKQLDEPIADVAVASLELYDNVYQNLKEGQIKGATSALVEGLKSIDAIYATIYDALLKAAQETPDLAENMKRVLTAMTLEAKTNKATIRERFGGCLAHGLPDFFE